ncbi:MAG: response regulator [Gemmatimonadota bacterium]
MSYSQVEILLVEDSPTDLELTKRALRRVNLINRLHVVMDGAEALDFLFGKGMYAGRDVSSGPRVVFLDLKLPKVDGLEVLEQVKRNPRTSGIPVVVLTSSAEERDLVESYRLGVNSYIVKPVDFEGFARAVADAGLYWAVLNRVPAAG